MYEQQTFGHAYIMTWFFAFSRFARRSASAARRRSSLACSMACCLVNAAVIWDAYFGFVNISTAVDLLVMVSHNGGGEDDGDGGVKDEDATGCFICLMSK
jgi:hypothetical protein